MQGQLQEALGQVPEAHGQVQEAIVPAKRNGLARSFARLGWAGFWLQLVFGSLPVLVMVCYFAFSRTPAEPRSGLRFVEYLTIVNLLALLFTMFWSYRYTRLARRIADPEHCPSESYVTGTVWTGLVAGMA